MTDFTIKDGKGKGVFAGVTSDHALIASARAISKLEAEARIGNSYNFNPGNITLTDTAESGVLYFKNNGDSSIIIDRIVYLLGTSTGGSAADWRMRVYRNPTAGTLITSGTTFVPVNIDFGSSNLLDGDGRKGAEGLTITASDGVVYDSWLKASAGGAHFIETKSLILQKGKSIAVTATPPTGNTSVTIQIMFFMYKDTLEAA